MPASEVNWITMAPFLAYVIIPCVVGPVGASVTRAAPDKKISGVDHPRRFLEAKSEKNAKPVSLATQKTQDPGYFRNWGVRGPVDAKIKGFGDMDQEFDATLDRSLWNGDSMSYDFQVMDNLNPTAPMDRIWARMGQIKNPDDLISHLTGLGQGGFSSPAYIPKFMNPDMFPTVVGEGCNCTMPLKNGAKVNTNAPALGTMEHAMFEWFKDWNRLNSFQKTGAKELGWTEQSWQNAVPPASSKKQWKDLSKKEQKAAGQFGWTVDFWTKRYEKLVLKTDPDFVKKMKKSRQEQAAWPNPSQKIECVCGKGDKNKDHYTWLKATPVGKGKYSLTPADLSYRGGDYWSPQPEGGIQSPSDRLPYTRYPLQASPDYVWPVPVSSSEDRVAIKYARYIDQVNERSRECDKVSKKCTTPCKTGDPVEVTIGNTLVKAQVKQVYVGNAIEVEYIPKGAVGAKETTACPLKAACTAFRFCRHPGKKNVCVNQQDIPSHNWAGNLVRKVQCPKGTKTCKTVRQVLSATYMTKGGKACRAAFVKVKK
jgi:hypothetical protein